MVQTTLAIIKRQKEVVQGNIVHLTVSYDAEWRVILLKEAATICSHLVEESGGKIV